MSEYIVKTYRFSLNSAIKRDVFLALSQEMDQLLLTIKGFVYRSVAEQENGEWLDIVYWDSVQSAGAAEPLMGEKIMDNIMKTIDAKTLNVHQATIVSQVYPEMQQSPA